MSWKVHETDDVFAALRGLCSDAYRMYDPYEYRHYYDHECDAYECAVENAAEEYARLLRHCDYQREQLSRYEKKESGMDNIDGGTEIERIRSSSITDELREWMDEDAYQAFGSTKLTVGRRRDLLAIADRIDERHSEELERMWDEAEGADLKAYEATHVLLPVDADGVPIRVGDYVETLIVAFEGERGRVECLTLTEDGWCVDGDAPSTVRHVQPDSWERIIGDALSESGWEQPKEYETDFEDSKETRDRFVAELVERCRRLAGE